MPGTSKSSVYTTSTKPNNVFFIWYTELCRRLNSNPVATIKPAKAKCNTVLDFAADRLKFEDWSPLLNALRHDTSLHVITIKSKMGNYQFLYDVDTEDKTRRLKRKYGCLWTDYILSSLVRALSHTLKNTLVLTCLELDGLPMYSQYLESFLKALQKNQTIKFFSLANCPIQDVGCRSVCSCLQLLPNVEVLNISRCELTSVSGVYIAKLIKFQQLNRYTTSWHNSLRYEEPDSGNMCGLKRITLNCNPGLGDEGLNYILDEMEDDLWIKALDMQKCGITDNIASKLIDVIGYNRSLEIADFRQNDALSQDAVDKILNILKEKNIYAASENHFQWCNSVLSLDYQSLTSSERRTLPPSTIKLDHNSLPPKQPKNGFVKNIPEQKSSNALPKANNNYIDSSRDTFTAPNRRKSVHINMQLQNEITKRKEAEKQNEELKEKISLLNNKKETIDSRIALKKVIKVMKKIETKNISTVRKPEVSKEHVNGYKNGFVVKNGYEKPQTKCNVSAANSACSIFEKLLLSKTEEEDHLLEDGQNLMNYYVEGADFGLKTILGNSEKYLNGDSNEMTDSQISLYKFMEEIKKDNSSTHNLEVEKKSSKYHYKGKKNGIK